MRKISRAFSARRQHWRAARSYKPGAADCCRRPGSKPGAPTIKPTGGRHAGASCSRAECRLSAAQLFLSNRIQLRPPFASNNDPLSACKCADLTELRIPTKPAMHSNVKPATCSDPKAAGVPI